MSGSWYTDHAPAVWHSERSVNSWQAAKKSAAGCGSIRKKVVKKNGKAKVYDVRPNITKESHSGWDSENKVVKTICDEVTDAIKKMPRWTPELYDGKPRETYCVVRLKLKGEGQ